jgi:hypothetical protein
LKDDAGLKTGERTITIREEFGPILRSYLDSSTSDWLVSSSTDEQWNSDGFGEALRRLNRKAGLAWTSQDYRHTFATPRLSEGWNLKTLADEIGNEHDHADGALHRIHCASDDGRHRGSNGLGFRHCRVNKHFELARIFHDVSKKLAKSLRQTAMAEGVQDFTGNYIASGLCVM